MENTPTDKHDIVKIAHSLIAHRHKLLGSNDPIILMILSCCRICTLFYQLLILGQLKLCYNTTKLFFLVLVIAIN